jgi:hypothetical protein
LIVVGQPFLPLKKHLHLHHQKMIKIEQDLVTGAWQVSWPLRAAIGPRAIQQCLIAAVNCGADRIGLVQNHAARGRVAVWVSANMIAQMSDPLGVDSQSPVVALWFQHKDQTSAQAAHDSLSQHLTWAALTTPVAS